MRFIVGIVIDLIVDKPLEAKDIQDALTMILNLPKDKIVVGKARDVWSFVTLSTMVVCEIKQLRGDFVTKLEIDMMYSTIPDIQNISVMDVVFKFCEKFQCNGLTRDKNLNPVEYPYLYLLVNPLGESQTVSIDLDRFEENSEIIIRK